MGTNYISEEYISSIKQYLEIIDEIRKSWSIQDHYCNMSLWYRGQNCDKSLLPSVFRLKKQIYGTEKQIHEFQLNNDFKALYRNYTNVEFTIDELCERYAFMQHHGIPTRLLDWTSNALFALFFSLYQPIENETSIVWVLNVPKLNSFAISAEATGPFSPDLDLVQLRFLLPEYLVSEDFNQVHEGINDFLDNDYDVYKRQNLHKYPVAFYPSSKDNMRIISQNGVFTIHGIQKLGIDEIIQKNNKEDVLFRILIDENNKKKIYQEIKQLGITRKTVFPDIEGLAQYLIEQWIF